MRKPSEFAEDLGIILVLALRDLTMWAKPHRLALTLFATATIMLGTCYRSFAHYTETGWIGIQRNQITGELSLDHAGFNFNPPWVWVAMMEKRPQRVCITSGAHAYNCRLVRFAPEHYEEFVTTEGWRYWWWSNRISFNMGYDEEYRGVYDILRGYAFGAHTYPFVEVRDAPAVP